MTTTDSRRSGLALFELVVALGISGIVLLAAHGLSATIGEAGARARLVASNHNAARNAERTLREMVGQIEVGPDSDGRFTGTPAATEFQTWCMSPGGWEEPCRVRLELEPRQGTAELAAMYGGRRLVLRRGALPARLVYLESPDGGGTWAPAWGASIRPPLAVLVVLGRDSLLLRIGERG